MTAQDAPPAQDKSTSSRSSTGFAGDVLKLVSGTTIAQILSILTAPILTRIYAPEAYGIMALFTSITSIIGAIACLRYEMAIMLPESDEEAINLLGLSLLFPVLISLLTIPAIFWGGAQITAWLNSPGLAPYLWLVSVMIFISGTFLALNYWNLRTKHYGRLSVARVSQTVTTSAAQLGFGFGGWATGGTMIGAVVSGNILATAVLSGQIWRDDGKLFRESVRWWKMKEEMKRYRKFPLYNTWAALLNTASWQLPAFLLSIFFSSSIVGFYALGFRLLYLPMSLVGTAIGQVFFQRAAQAYVQGTLAALVENTFRQLVAFGLVPMLLLAIIGEALFSFAFGQKWSQAGVYTQILALWAFFWFVSSPISTLFSVLERQEYSLWIQLVIFVTRLGSLLIGGYLGSIYVALGLFSASGILVYGFLCFRLLYETGVPFSYGAKQIGFYFALFAPIGVALLYMKWNNASDLATLSVALLYSVGYGIYLIKTQRILGDR